MFQPNKSEIQCIYYGFNNLAFFYGFTLGFNFKLSLGYEKSNKDFF